MLLAELQPQLATRSRFKEWPLPFKVTDGSEDVDFGSNAVAPIGGLGGVPPKIPKQFFFIGFIDSMFKICTCISSFSTF